MGDQTNEEIAAERDRLQAENEQLKAQLSAVGAGTTQAAAPAHTFQLSEADRQELEQRGWINYRGTVMTTDDVRRALGKDQGKVKIKDAPKDAPKPPTLPTRNPVAGVDYVPPATASDVPNTEAPSDRPRSRRGGN
jgi:hypothetical protein